MEEWGIEGRMEGRAEVERGERIEMVEGEEVKMK